MTDPADRWGIHPAQFWLRGDAPANPVAFDEQTGMWNVYGHEEACQVLGDPKAFSSAHVRDLFPVEQPAEMTEGNLLDLDPPDHRKLRNLVSKAFSGRVVADLEPRITALTHELLDRVDTDRFELVSDLAYPLPVIVIAELLGLPPGDRDLFRDWVDGLFAQNNEFSLNDSAEKMAEDFAAAADAIGPLQEYLRGHIADRRKRPGEDLISSLVQAEVDGERLNDNEVANFSMILLVAGHITTTMLLGNTVLCLDTHPAQRDRVRADRSLVPVAIEESLRFFTPFAAVARATTVPVTVGDREVPADQLLMVWMSAANRDARRFADPHVFDAGRDPNPHLGFGRGIHFCVGAPLARLEGRIAVNALLDRFPGLHVDPDQVPTFMPSPTMTGVKTLPLRV